MSIQISHLSKSFGSQWAVRDISFGVERGEIVGFLGPNGAGKSTTMKIATGYLPPSSGDVSVAGFDVVADPMEVKKRVGYLPEHNPLYLDMYVREYLAFSGRLFGIRGLSLKTRVEKMIELCGLTREQTKKIESLSKGYRQRVGLAQALIHDPEVLILDEPTSGLDPNQIVEIRKLIREVSRDKTVLFSTHILQEVRAICDRIVVIHLGEIVANDTVDNILQRRTRQIVVEFMSDVPPEAFHAIAGVREVERIGTAKFRITASEDIDIRPGISRLAAERQFALLSLTEEERSLEKIFNELTGETAGP